MARWLARVRRVGRPGPIFWDALLALAVAAFSLVNVDADRGVIEPVPPNVELSSTPFGLDPGDPWDVEITVTNPRLPLAEGEPRLTIIDSRTGETKIYDSTPIGAPAMPGGAPAVYRVRAVFPRPDTYSFFVSGGGLEPYVTIGNATAEPIAPPGNEHRAAPLETWLVVLALLASLPIAVRRRFPVTVLAVTLNAPPLINWRLYPASPCDRATASVYRELRPKCERGEVQTLAKSPLIGTIATRRSRPPWSVP